MKLIVINEKTSGGFAISVCLCHQSAITVVVALMERSTADAEVQLLLLNTLELLLFTSSSKAIE